MNLLDKFLDLSSQREKVEREGGIWTDAWIALSDRIAEVRSKVSVAFIASVNKED
jgi:hypothetical protein